MIGESVGQLAQVHEGAFSVPVKPNIIGVYTITCTANGMVYVGSSKNVFNRISGHISKLRNGHHERKNLLADFVLHGEAAFDFAVASLQENVPAARMAEADLIAHYRKAKLCYNVMAVSHYTPRLTKAVYARVKPLTVGFDPAARLKVWMEAKGMRVADLRSVLKCSRHSAYRIMWGGLPSYDDMRAICEWTTGEVTPNDFYNLSALLGKRASSERVEQQAAA